MCRLFALSSDKPLTPQQRYVFNMMTLHSSRMNNKHGTGIAVLSGRKIHYDRSGLPAEDFILTDAWNGVQNIEHSTVFGHTRLASTTWRQGWNQAYPKIHAHPHKVNKYTLLMHNGSFDEHRRLADRFKLGDVKNVTDTMAFCALLNEAAHGNPPTASSIISALGEAGRCEYSMFILATAANPIIVRGDRDLFVAWTNYGLMINTAKTNIEDTIKDTALALLSMGHQAVELLEEIKLMDPWSIWTLDGMTLTKVEDIPEETRKKNKPPIVVRSSTPASNGGAQFGDVDWDFIEGLATEYTSLREMLPSLVSDAEIGHMLSTASSSRDDPRCNWWEFTPREMEQLRLLLQWAFDEKTDICYPSPEKDDLWLQFLIANNFEGDEYTLDPYVAAVEIVPTLTIPYFLNSVEELEALVS